MAFQIDINSLKTLTNSFSYKINGNIHEVQSGQMVTDLFPYSELFWKTFITPMTNRVDVRITNPDEKIHTRKNISMDIVDISIIHYSVFLNLVYANVCLTAKHLSYFENFYAHLGSVCDLAEELITQVYLVTLECEEKETELFPRLRKTKCLELASEWYDKYYSGAYDNYLSKGKVKKLDLPHRTNILKEYYGDELAWKNYSNLASKIRNYRNVIVHNSLIGYHITPQGIYVPKMDKISNYKKFHQVFDVKVNQDKFLEDFIERDSQMEQGLKDLKTALNNLWLKPFQHLDRLFYLDKTPKLLTKYDIEPRKNN